MTPSLRGRRATMLPGVRPSILFAALPTATTLSVLLSMATTEGSERTIPCPLTNTSVFAVPRSIATSLPNNPPNISYPICSVRIRKPRGLEHPVLFHTKVTVAHDNVVQHLHTQYPGGLTHPLRDLAVLPARLDLAAGVVVRQYDTRGTRPDSRFEDLPGVNEGSRERAYGDRGGLDHLVFGVEQHNDKILPIEVGYAPPQKPLHVRGR